MESESATSYVEQIPEAKCVVLGDAGVGKTCILSRFISGEFEELVKSTTGPKFDKKTIQVGKQRIKLKLWDTAG